MIGNYFARLTGSKRNLVALVASSVVLTAGCANMSSVAPTGTNPFSSPASLSGTIHGGNQPVIGATVTLWFAGQGAPAIKAATTTTDSLGSFSFTKDSATPPGSHDGTTSTYSCPTTVGDPLVYVVSKGGNTQNNGVPTQNNSAAAFIALYGSCATLTASNFVYMSEVTTVATMAAVQQFFNPAADTNGNNDTLRADSTGQQRLIMLNLPNTVKLLADAATGLAVPSTSLTPAAGGNIAPGVSLTATPETAKINTIANIISACINGATSATQACATIQAAAAPPIGNTTSLNTSFAPATDALQALFYIFTNPTNSNTTNMSALFGLQPAVGAPYQPSLAAVPTDWTIGVSYASTGASSSCAAGNFISSPNDVSIDGLDNVWFGNSQAGGNLSSISAAGAPLACINFDPGTSGTGGTVDLATNVWSAGGTTLYRYNPTTQATLAFPVGVNPLAMTADGAGNVYFSAASGGVGSVYQIPNGAGAAAAVAPVQISSTVGAAPLRMMADASSSTPKLTPGNIWVSSGSTFISQITPGTGGAALNGFITTPFTTSGNSWGVGVDRANNVFVSAIDTGAITQLQKSGTTWASPGSPWPFTAATAGISSPKGIAVDGRSNNWIANSGAGSLSEISFFGANPLSPTTGFQKASTFFNSNRNIAVDQAGNVWIVGVGNNFVTEIVGQGVPIFAPYAVGINIGRFQQIP